MKKIKYKCNSVFPNHLPSYEFAKQELSFLENVECWVSEFAKAESEQYVYYVGMLNTFCLIAMYIYLFKFI